MIRFVISWMLIVFVVATARGQNASNPFEMAHRLSGVAPAAGELMQPNPFDVKPHRPPGVSKVLTERISEPFRPSRLLPRHGDNLSNQFLFWILVAVFTFMTLSVAANRKAVGRAWRAFLNDNGLSVAQREASGFVGITPYLLMYANFLLNAGIFMFLVMRIFRRESFNNLTFLFICLAAAGIIFITKHLLLSLTGWLFPVEKEVRHYNFLITVFNCVLGLFLLPFNFLLAFSTGNKHFLAFWALGLILIFYLYRAFRSSRISTKFLADNQFHFLLYLCAVEIAPVLLVIKLAMIQAR